MKGIKLYLGILLLFLSFMIPLSGFWVATLQLPLAIKGTVIGLLTVGGPEVLAIVAVALLGKEFFNLLTGRLLSALGRLAPQGSVSRTRYRVGLVLFIATFIPSYLLGYAPQLLPDTPPIRLYVLISADLLFVISLFILGGDFWEKLRSLFVYDARPIESSGSTSR